MFNPIHHRIIIIELDFEKIIMKNVDKKNTCSVVNCMQCKWRVNELVYIGYSIIMFTLVRAIGILVELFAAEICEKKNILND